MLERPPEIMGNGNEYRDEQSNSESQETSEFSFPLPSGKSGIPISGWLDASVLGVIREEGFGLPILRSLLWSLRKH